MCSRLGLHALELQRHGLVLSAQLLLLVQRLLQLLEVVPKVVTLLAQTSGLLLHALLQQAHADATMSGTLHSC